MEDKIIQFTNCSKSPEFDATLLLQQKGGWTPVEWTKPNMFEHNDSK